MKRRTFLKRSLAARHDLHATGLTGEQVYHAFAGTFFIEDRVSANLSIPKTYGADDIPLAIQDRRFFADDEFAYIQNMDDVQFQILSRNGRLPPLHKQGRKDTVLVMPGETVQIIRRFHDHTGSYMYHSHLLEHEDDTMMGQFKVVT